MPFGKYAEKSVQSMSGLFNMRSVNLGFAHIGSMGKRGTATAARGVEGELISLGRKRAAVAGAGVVALGALGRSSGSRGLNPRSSAPPTYQGPGY